MLLRGTLPVVQLEFDKNSQTAVIKGDGQPEVSPKQAPARPARTPKDQTAQNPLQPTPAPPQQAPASSWKPAASISPSQPAQHPLQPVTAEELVEVSESAVEPTNAGGLDGADVVPSNTGAVAKPQPAAPEEKWDLKAFKLLDTVRGTQAECITADDKLVYTGSGDGSISIWDPVELKHTTNIKAHTKAVKSILLRENTLFFCRCGCSYKGVGSSHTKDCQ
jgi:hypothetical protein